MCPTVAVSLGVFVMKVVAVEVVLVDVAKSTAAAATAVVLVRKMLLALTSINTVDRKTEQLCIPLQTRHRARPV